MTLLDLLQDKGFGPYRKSGSRFVGPCPTCGGTVGRSFVTKIDSDTGYCFACGGKFTAVKLLMTLDGLKCKDAHAALGKNCDNTGCPVWDKCHGTPTRRRSAAESVTVPATRPADHFTPSAGTTPAEKWQEKAGALVEWAHQQLLANRDQLAYLAGRGLALAAVERYRLGWIPDNLYRERSAWGLPEELNYKGQSKRLWIPRGHVIPSYDLTGTINRVRIRRTNADLEVDRKRNPKRDPLRYYAIPGSGNDLAIIGNPAAKAVVVVESDLDALLLHHLAGDFVATIPLTTVTARPRESTTATLAGAAVILIALDADQAGAKNWEWWHARYPQAEQCLVPVGKDPGEAYQQGADLRLWLLEALPISCHPARVVAAQAEREEQPVAPTGARHYLTATGRTMTVAYDRETFLALAGEGTGAFTPKELEMVTAADVPVEVDELLLDIKEAFLGAWLKQIEKIEEVTA